MLKEFIMKEFLSSRKKYNAYCYGNSSFNVAPYFQLKKTNLFFIYLIPERFLINVGF